MEVSYEQTQEIDIMLRDITIGQYYPSGSILHRLDPRVKLAATLLYIISLFPFNKAPVYILATVYLVTMVILSKVPLSYIAKGLKPVVILLLFTGVVQLISARGDNIIFSYGYITIYDAGIINALTMVMKLIYLVIGSSLMTYTTTPNELTDGIEKALRPLNRIKVPVHEFALVMSLALRFIPILIEEADKIIKAQASRGGNIEEGKIIERAKSMAAIFVPLLISAIKRANDLAYAMDARCYHGGAGRTKLHPLSYKRADVVGYIIVLAYFAGIIVIGIVM